MRRLLWVFIFLFPIFSFSYSTDQNKMNQPYQSDDVKLSSNLNIPTPTFQVRNYRFNGFYIGFNAGVAAPGGKTFESEFATGADIVPQIGYQLGQGRIEFAPIFTFNDADMPTITNLFTYTMMFNGYYDFPYSAIPISPRLTPYLGIGMGWINETGGDNAQAGPNQTEWAYQFIIGTMYRLTLNWYIQVNYHLMGWPDRGGHFNFFNIGFTYHFL